MLASRMMTTSRALSAGVRHVARTPMHMNMARARSVTTVKAYTDAPPARELTFASYDIYKGKAALQFKAILPTWDGIKTQSGAQGWQVRREGVLLMEFANIGGGQGQQSGYGERSYDWANKISFALKPTELAAIADLDFTNQGATFTHDPEKGKEGAGSIIKTLSIKPGQSNDGSWMFYINSAAGNNKTSVAVPVNRQEYKAIQILANFLLPRLLGFDMVFETAGHQSA